MELAYGQGTFKQRARSQSFLQKTLGHLRQGYALGAGLSWASISGLSST